MNDEATIQFTDVRKVFAGRSGGAHVAVDDVSLLLDSTSRLGIVGESGSGKSTMVRMLMGLEIASSGSVEYRGRDLASLKKGELREFRRNVQLVAQDTSSSFDPRRTLRDGVRRPLLELMELSTKEADAQVDQMLASLSIDPGLADRKPHQVSGGQRQRFSIARALVVGPKLIVCDEAVSALDVSVQGAVLNLLKDHCENSDAGLVFVSHGLPATAFICEELIVMYEGRIVEQGSVQQVIFASEHPYTKSLVDAYRTTSGASA
ncbi:ABC transporter ATP-binding protein [Rhodococcoides fascians]|uniref:ABC transporter ATP-binding protein n=1 Tax=Rhodococcoides fascians TaxID=1828 RepID=UPI0009B919AB|nr:MULTISPECIES: ATP-binding cassette domain-containing protein [Rhodococcus]OZF05378.1 ABC transporter ATP-binding protein [Rhodococcus sp. 15-1189-1-1a]OZF20164.1 ABC transporter ATP-binding protein [Rhodococcus sp. 14-2686-1-2]